MQQQPPASDATQAEEAEASVSVTLGEFLTEVPPGRLVEVQVDWEAIPNVPSMISAEVPSLRLHCDHPDCGGPRYFDSKSDMQIRRMTSSNNLYVTATCGNCKQVSKTYALRVQRSNTSGTTRIEKYGERPAFGGPTPTKLLTLLGSDRETFLKGRRAEQQAMGIAAFAYYRRVVDNKRVRLFERIITVARTVGADPALIEDLEAAKQESQFTEAVKKIKHALPQVLLIKGQDPLTLLYSALSEGLHNRSDEECLEDAAAVRQVLTGFVERLSTALEEDREMSEAVKRLAERRGKR